MAKSKGGSNKSAAIRDYIDANPGAKPRAIVEALKAQGHDVSAAFVSTIKSKYISSGGVTKSPGRPKGSGKKKAGRKATVRGRVSTSASSASATGAGGAYEELILAKQLADKLGGVANAKAALSALEKITG